MKPGMAFTIPGLTFLKEEIVRTIFLISILLVSCSAIGQWRKIADLPGYAYGTTVDEPVTSVYFLTLPGPPRIGFAGTEVGLWKTTDGGNTWTKVWNEPYSVTQICFKDSLEGWFSAYNGSGFLMDTACYQTNDGGNTWKPVEIRGSIFGSNAIYYEPNNNYLFLSLTDSCLLLSKDLGKHWRSVTTFQTGGISFFNDSNGIAAIYPSNGDTSYLIARTSDGGQNWDSVQTISYCKQPLAIRGSMTAFAYNVGPTQIYRSDDYGRTWRLLSDLGFDPPYADGVIGGDLSRLYILTDQGMYHSTDEGVTWNLEPESPKYNPDGQGGQTFYCANGVTVAGATDISGGQYDGAGLWEEAWPQSSVSSPEPNSDAISIFPNPTTGMVTITGAGGAVEVENILGERVSIPHATTPQPPPLAEEGELTLDLSRLPAGTYFVRVGTRLAKVLVAH